MLIQRPSIRRRVADAFRAHPAVALLGPRQCGKSTLARMIAEDEPEATFFDLGHPKAGASFEGFAIEQLCALFGLRNVYFWGTHAGAELDLLATVNGLRHGFEFKLADAPGTTRSMHVALAELGIEHLWVVYPGAEAYALGERISALPVAGLGELAARLGAVP